MAKKKNREIDARDYYKCPVCSNCRLWRTIPRKVGGQVAECSICGHLTLWPLPNEKEVLSQYSESAFLIAKNVGIALFDHQAFDLLKKYDKRSNLHVLDVGCGLGEFLRKCIQEKHKATGIEVTKNIVNQLQSEGLDVHNKTLSEFRNIQQRYDWVACLDVIEHIRDPMTAIEVLAELVNEKGFLVIQSPNGDAIKAYREKAYGLQVDKEHLNYFSPEQLIRLFELNGLTFVCKKYYPASTLTGRAKVSSKNKYNNSSPMPNGGHTYRSNIAPDKIRSLMEKMPARFRGILRSSAQVLRYIGSIDEILKGKAHGFIIVMKRH